jgi:hypothetical protein
MRQLFVKIFLFASILATPSFLSGQAAPWSRLGAGARGMAAGNAAAAAPGDGIYALYNPAHAGFVISSNVEVTSGIMPFGMRWNTVSGSFRLPPSAGLQIGLMHNGVPDIDLRTPSGYPSGTATTSEFLVFGTFGVALSDNVHGGVSFKGYRSRLHPEVDPATATSLDVGLLAKLTKQVQFALAVHDIIGDFRWRTQSFYGEETAADRKFDIPMRFTAALALEFQPGRVASVEIQTAQWNGDAFFVPEPFPGFNRSVEEHTVKVRSTLLRAAYRHRFDDRITARAGLASLPDDPGALQLSGGFSIELPFDRYNPAIDYAAVRSPYGLGLMHIFSLRFLWNAASSR